MYVRMEGAVLSTQGNSRFRSHLKSAASALCRVGAGGSARTLPKQRVSSKQLATQHHHTFPKVANHRHSSIGKNNISGLFKDTSMPVQTEPPVFPPEYLNGLSNSAAAVLSDDDDKDELSFPQRLVDGLDVQNGLQKLKGKMAREVASAWSVRVGAPSAPAPADRVQSLFNDLHLYPTKTQVFEMLVCARQCAGRKSLALTFGEFCVFAAELRKCSRRARQSSSKPESPYRAESSRENKENPRVINGSEASPPPSAPCEVFLGGSCNPTTWRSEIAIPMLDKMGITYFNPQVAEWSLELVEVENRAKQAARALLFVLDSETRAVAAGVEAAQLAALGRDLLLVLRPYKRGQRIGNEIISDQEYVELSRARATLQEVVERRGLPAFTDIPSALRCARAVLRGARTHPRQPLGHTILRLKRAFDVAGSKATRISRARAIDAVVEIARVTRETADRSLPATDSLDFESFCAAVAELTADQGDEEQRCTEAGCAPATPAVATRGMAERVRRVFRNLRDKISGSGADQSSLNGQDSTPTTPTENRCAADFQNKEPTNGIHRQTSKDKNKIGYEASYNSRLKACGKKLGLFIPKSGGSREGAECNDAVFTPGTEERLEHLPSMLSSGGSPLTPPTVTPGNKNASTPTDRRLERLPSALHTYKHDVYLGGSIPSDSTRPEETLRSSGLTFVVPRVNDYTRMFSAPARRAAPAHPESPRTDKKPRPSRPTTPASPYTEEVQLREKDFALEPSERLSASDFYTVSEDVTPQPFKGTYEEELLWSSRVLLFSVGREAPSFSAMVLAAHYMELRPGATVLMVQALDRATGLSETAVKDYNRGRHYLRDLAKRSGVPVFDTMAEAMVCVVDKVNNTQE